MPWLAVDWRWRRSCQIVEQGGYATIERDGELVQRTVRYTRLLERATTERGVRRAVRVYPDIYLALKLLQEFSTRVLELKARVLAGQADQTIATQLGLPKRTVTTFVAMFFDVRPRLQAKTWIQREAIGLPLDQNPGAEHLLLLQAWRRGPTVIEPWLDYLQHREEQHDLTTEIGRQRASLALLIRVQQLAFEPSTLRSLWKLSYFTLAKSPKTVGSATVNATVLRNRSQILGEISWNESENGEFENFDRVQPTASAGGNRKSGRYAQTG